MELSGSARQNNPRITTAMFGARYRSKTEVYSMLTVDAKVSLPPVSCVTIWFLRDICSGKKKKLKVDDCKVLFVPQYEGLAISDVLDFAQQNAPHVFEYLPDKQDMGKVPRQWLCNLIYSLHDEFGAWVREKIEERNQKIASDRNLVCDLDPEIAQVFLASTAVCKQSLVCCPAQAHSDLCLICLATKHGSGFHALKAGSKRRRTKEQIFSDQAESLVKEQAENESKARIRDLERQLQLKMDEVHNNSAASNILNRFIENGQAVVDASGDVRLVNQS